MEAKAQATEQIGGDVKKLAIVAQGESIIKARVQQEVEKMKAELSGSSMILAAVLGMLAANALTYTYIQLPPLTSDYKYLWATLIGLVAGAALGERIMLVAIGILLGLKLAAL